MSYSPRNLFEEIPRTTNRTCGSCRRQVLLQGQAGPSEYVPPLWYPPPQESYHEHIPTRWRSKAFSSAPGAKIQVHAVCQLLSLLAKEKPLAVFHCFIVKEMCVFCVKRARCCAPSCLWSVCTSCGKQPWFANQSPRSNWLFSCNRSPKVPDQQDSWRKNSHRALWLKASELLFLATFHFFLWRQAEKKNDRRKEPAESVWAWFSFVLTLHYRTPSLVSLTLYTAGWSRARWRGGCQSRQGKERDSLLQHSFGFRYAIRLMEPKQEASVELCYIAN